MADDVGRAPSGQALVQAPSPAVSAASGFDPSRIREALRRVFDNEITFAFVAKGMSGGGFPMDRNREMQSWSDWLTDQIELEMEAL